MPAMKKRLQWTEGEVRALTRDETPNVFAQHAATTYIMLVASKTATCFAQWHAE